MLSFIRSFPQQLHDGAEAAMHITHPGRSFDQIVISGMGGSALPGDILQELLDEHIAVNVCREYSIPKRLLHAGTVVFISSFSGNTEETIASLEDARSTDAYIIVLTHGGKLAELAKTYDLPLIILPEAIQPRCATGLFLSALLTALHNLGCSPDMQEVLQYTQHTLETKKEGIEEQAKTLANILHTYVPIIYSGKPLAPVARITKINFNETSKVQSFWNVLPEMNHNEMVGYTTMIMKPYMLFLRTSFDHPRVHLRMDVFQNILTQKEIPFQNIHIEGETLLEQHAYTLFLAYFSSYYLATAYGVDPAPVDMVETFKALLVS